MNTACSVTRSYGDALLTGLFFIGFGISAASAQTYRVDAASGDLTEREVRIIQTNSGGTDIHIFDPGTMEQVAHVNGIVRPHGATMHPDGKYFYITNEHDATVDALDTRTFQVTDKIQLSSGPHNLAGSDLARKLYVALIGEPLIQVIDMDTHQVIKNIPTGGGVHNTFVTPDGRYALGGMIGASEIICIDTATDEVVWVKRIDYQQSPMVGGVRPFTFTTHADGSTRSILVNLGGWHGFWELDWETQEVLNKISPPEHAWKRTEQTADGIQSSPSHGIVVLPNQSQVWVSSRATSHIYGWTLPEFEYVGRVFIGNPAWLTATPDSSQIWVGVASHNETAVVDVSRQEVIKRFPVGQAPKRIYTAIFPENWTAEAN